MKYLILCLFLFGTTRALAHKPIKVQTEDQAIQRYTEEAVTFRDMTVPDGVRFVKAMRHGEADSLELVVFTVKADWGPITGLIALQKGEVVGLEILTFTEHEGKGVTKAVFLDQYKGLSLANLETKTIRPLPKEPKTSQALLEAVKLSLDPQG